ncbi:MarR family winged helix-turn-helix transcriptional regulator [Crossiella sp. NPDC003009]
MTSNAAEAFDRAFLLAARLAELMQQALAGRGLTPARAEVLFVLRNRGPLVQRELSQELRCSPRHVTGLVDGLSAGGFVRRQPHPTDRRASLVALTDRGQETADWILSSRRQAAEAVLGDQSAARLTAFVAVVDRIVERLGQPEPRGSA